MLCAVPPIPTATSELNMHENKFKSQPTFCQLAKDNFIFHIKVQHSYCQP